MERPSSVLLIIAVNSFQKFSEIMEKFGIKHIKSTPHNPTDNSIIERINKEIGIVLRISRGLSLTKLIKNIWSRLNLNISISTEYAPMNFFSKNQFLGMEIF
ncbi:hypothetical protein EQH57_0609 [Dictyocoela roeselum]|nr:hypothetical protein EQH57_0609 [Dictyocoela roeselum]